MRPSQRLAAVVKRGAEKYLEAGAPTGLTGLLTHPSPRTELLYLYSATLEKLQKFPDHSVYRKSTEALTKHRMNIVESTKPEGLSEWQQRVAAYVDEHPTAFRRVASQASKNRLAADQSKADAAIGGEFNFAWKAAAIAQSNETLGENEGYRAELYKGAAPMEGPKDLEDAKAFAEKLLQAQREAESRKIEIEPEPPLTKEQIEEIETKIGAGLIEEVVQVAEGELKLVDVMLENETWADLEEKPAEGQWKYHERDTFTGTTQAP